ncbi:MAG TPA: hypothetical protein VJ974_08170 [Geopsychrobacteraceae bacterium]|nr:hypothetical protein [Geopsychrobacteraceae bacterium]
MPETAKIKVQAESGQILDVVVTSMKVDAIWILLGEGEHSIKCKLEPTRNGLAYAGSIMGREIIYNLSVKDVTEQIARNDTKDYSFKWNR